MADFRDLEVCDRKDLTEFGILNVLGVTVATNGYQGGDSGHGGRTYVSIENIADSDTPKRYISGPYWPPAEWQEYFSAFRHGS